MKRCNLEIIVGLFVVLGLAALAYLSVARGQIPLVRRSTYTLTALFPTVAGLHVGATIDMAGVRIGQVQDIRLEDYAALVIMRLDNTVRLQEDAIASIRTQGLIGEKYVRMTPGGSERFLAAGGRLREIEPPIEVEDLIGKFLQGDLTPKRPENFTDTK